MQVKTLLSDIAYLRLGETERRGEVLALLPDYVVVLTERFLQLQQLRRRERCPDALRFAERKQETGRRIRPVHCMYTRHDTIHELEVCMGMGNTGIPWVPWDSHGNGSKISHGMGMGWERELSAWEWELRRGNWQKNAAYCRLHCN